MNKILSDEDDQSIQDELDTELQVLLKAAAFLIWSGLITVLTFAMYFALAAQGPQPGQTIDQHHAAIGGAYIIVTGCAGGGWLCGLLVIVLIAAVLRD